MSAGLRTLSLFVALLLVAPAFVSGGCARRALADEYTVADDYATSDDVSSLTGAVDALTGAVSDDMRDVSDDLAVVGSQVDTLIDNDEKESETLDEILDTAKTTQDRLGATNNELYDQGDKLAAVSDKVVETNELVKSMAEQEGASEVEAMELETLLALVPEGASAEIVSYMQYPFIWGMAAGIVGYLISLVIGGFYRLLGFR